MKIKIVWLIPLFAAMLAACSRPAEQTPILPGAYPVPAAATEAAYPPAGAPVIEAPEAYPQAESPMVEPTHAAPESALYRDDQAGYELDYPVGWMLEASSEVGSRGSQAVLTSWGHQPGDWVTDRPQDSTLVTLMVYQWDPQHDLEAYTAQRKLAWEASGMNIVSEERLELSGLQEAQVFVVETLEKQQVFFLFTTVGEAYLQISGDGDLELVRQIALTTRVFSQ